MRKKLIFVVLTTMLCLSGCQGAVKSYGGEMTLDLPVDTKLELITWKDDELWYLTRPMRDDETAETHTYQESSEWGVFEGTVTIIEHASEQREIEVKTLQEE